MSSANIHSTVNASSPTSSSTVAVTLPSVFELLAEERLSELLRPCLQHIIKFLHDLLPTSTILKIFYKYKDELILLVDGWIQWVYLHNYSSLLGEHFYGLKRSADNRIRTLIITVFLPYVKLKINSICKQINENPNNRHKYFLVIARLMPQIETFFEGVCWLYRIGYAFGKTEYYSPLLQLAGAKLYYDKPKPVDLPKTMPGRLFSLVNQTLSAGLFLVQFADWLKAANGKKKSPGDGSASIPVPIRARKSRSSPQQKCGICEQTCNVPTAVTGSGYVYCYQCITEYVEKNQRCPKTNQPITKSDLVKMFRD